MTHILSGISLRYVLGVGGLAFATSVILVMLVVTGYAFALGFAARGQPNHVDIQRFAAAIGPTLGPILASILSAGGALWVAARARTRPLAHGLLVGVVIGAGVLAIEFSQSVDLVDLAKVVAVVVAAWLGSALAALRRPIH